VEQTGVDLPSGAWISGGLAAAFAMVLAALRLQARRRARLTWPPRASVDTAAPSAPDVVEAAASATELTFDNASALPGLIPDPPHPPVAIGSDRHGHDIALHTLAAAGLALTGPGTSPTARAMIASALATGVLGALDERPHVVTTTEVLTRLLPPGAPVTGLDPATTAIDGERLHLRANTRAAVTRFEQEMLYRRRILDSHDVASVADLDPDHGEALPPFVLLIPADEAYLERVDAVCRQGEALALAAVVLGATDPLPSAHVDAHGYLTSDIDSLHGTRLATLTATDLDDLLGVLRQITAGEPEPHANADTGTGTGEDTGTAADTGDGTHPVGPDRPVSPDSGMLAPPPRPGQERPPVVQLQVLGGVRLVTASGPITANVRRDSYLLLALLAAHPHGRTLEEIVDAIIPTGVDPVAAKKRSRTATTSLRTLLREHSDHPDAMFIVHDSTRYRLEAELFDVDLWRMLTALDAATRAEDDANALTALHAVADAYGGDFAAGFDRPWIVDLAGVYRHQALSALGRIAEITEADRPDVAVAALERALVFDPVNEELYQRLMRIHGRRGHLDAVQRTQHLCEERLAALGDAEPSETTRRVAERQLHRVAPVHFT
jgi:DNA-binding SARP family transcriptional activator